MINIKNDRKYKEDEEFIIQKNKEIRYCNNNERKEILEKIKEIK